MISLREFFLNNLWRWKAGKSEVSHLEKVPDFFTLQESQWSDRFEQLMRNRLIMGAFRYGIFKKKNKPTFKSIDSIINRCNLYKASGNDEHLVDIANLAMVEYIEGKHPMKHFKAADDGIHTEEVK